MFEVGRIYNRRKDIHDAYGGQRQGGISTPKGPYIFLFTSPSGEQYGYKDGWNENGVFLLTGEGQAGDMRFVRGNRSIRDHIQDGKDLLLFEFVNPGQYRHLGNFTCPSWEYQQGLDISKNDRQVIVFHLVLNHEVGTWDQKVPSNVSVEELRRAAYDSVPSNRSTNTRETRQMCYGRSNAVRIYVLARSGGICEACSKKAPFNRNNGDPYLEPHHIRRLSDDGLDSPEWVAAVCPNCHREIHYGENGHNLNVHLQNYVERLETT